MRKIIYILLLVSCLTPGVCRGQLNKIYFILATEDLIAQREFRDAITTINIYIKSNSQSHEAYVLRANAKYYMGDIAGARQDLDIAIDINPLYSYSYERRAIVEQAMGNHERALNDVNEAIALRPDKAAPYYIRGALYLHGGEYGKSVEDLNRFIIRNGSVTDAYTNRAAAYLGLGDTVRAMNNFNMALAVDRNDPAVYNRRGALYFDMADHANAIADFNRAIIIDTTYSSAYFNRAITYMRGGKNALSLYDLNRVIELQPLNWRAYFNRAIIYAQAGTTVFALQDMDKVLDINPANPRAYFNRALLRSQTGNFEGALSDYNHASVLLPNNVKIYFNRANTYRMMGENTKALQNIDRVIELFPDFGNAYLSRSSIKYSMGDMVGSRRDKELSEQKSAEYRNKYTDDQFAALTDTSTFFRQLTSFEENVQSDAYLSMYVRDKTEFRPAFRLGFAHPDSIAREKSYGAAAELTKEIQNATGNHNIYFTNRADAAPVDSAAVNKAPKHLLSLSLSLSAARGEMGDYSGAIVELNKAAEQHSDCAYIYYNRGNMYAALGLIPIAMDNYTRAIELDPQLGDAYFNRGLTHISLRETTRGILDFSKAGELGIAEAYDVMRLYSQATDR